MTEYVPILGHDRESTNIGKRRQEVYQYREKTTGSVPIQGIDDRQGTNTVGKNDRKCTNKRKRRQAVYRYREKTTGSVPIHGKDDRKCTNTGTRRQEMYQYRD